MSSEYKGCRMPRSWLTSDVYWVGVDKYRTQTYVGYGEYAWKTLILTREPDVNMPFSQQIWGFASSNLTFWVYLVSFLPVYMTLGAYLV